MEAQFQKSFIPKKPLFPIQASGLKSAGKGKTNLVSLVVAFLFIASLVISGGIFAYQQILLRQTSVMKADLEKAAAELKDNFLTKIITLDKRLKSAKIVLSNHVAVSSFFDSLEKLTVPSVQFTGFSYTTDIDGTLAVELAGTAVSFAAVAIQSDVFAQNPDFINPIFYDLNLNKDNKIEFSFRTQVKPTSLNYAKSSQ